MNQKKKQQVVSEAESLRLTIEKADNGILIRDDDFNGDVTVVLQGSAIKNPDGYGYDIDHTDEFLAIGKKVYEWLTEEVELEHHEEMILTGFDIHISAVCVGREIYE